MAIELTQGLVASAAVVGAPFSPTPVAGQPFAFCGGIPITPYVVSPSATSLSIYHTSILLGLGAL